MLLQVVLTAFMVYLRVQGYVQSDYLLYLSAVSILMLVSMTVELFIRPREKAVEWKEVQSEQTALFLFIT